MTERIMNYVSWKVVASAVCVILITMAGTLWSNSSDRIKAIEFKLDKKVDHTRYDADIIRMEKKIDQLIDMHMTGAPYRRLDK